ncbi:cell wall-associated NlpC family hydrolase [Bifidobacterium commune]|uniref:C40 family peptidase n=1 Tax=Bifidobacterium commune TaxID=1505727 RepID=UPI000B89C7EF|nr:C40 family peptidase [Bifidobacterium commune]MBB2955106.1 cell wall-associated NlpC family hydrolase [Bifidobacterium commune]
MIKPSRVCASVSAFILASSAFLAFSPVASASSEDKNPVTSSRSFHKVNTVRKDLFKESTSTDVDEQSNWGGIESLDVPQTQSQSEKDQAAAKQRAADAAAASAAAASRSRSRESLTAPSVPSQNVAVIPPNGQSVSGLLTFANQFVGVVPYRLGGNTPAGWDCSGFVQYVYGNMGISVPHGSGAQMSVGTPVADISQAMPGDIIANAQHSAIYVGNGMVINALNPASGTVYTPIRYAFTGSYSIRRLL